MSAAPQAPLAASAQQRGDPPVVPFSCREHTTGAGLAQLTAALMLLEPWLAKHLPVAHEDCDGRPVRLEHQSPDAVEHAGPAGAIAKVIAAEVGHLAVLAVPVEGVVSQRHK
eukprot:CAMPEP_0117525120 /NCGR_PEP_ID=MMETSP0784-20121206/35600_1 /TAXON_ID=39447 /ORGANISM="" /LENGTH=111 /DNA_ID=CAMNT_0005321295 /DNA_START=39 /DNA_END=375 /DNA_ORIENTATION=-